jgi:hypothetical protein
MHTLPAPTIPYANARFVPFRPFADRAGMATKRNTILAQLSEERSKARPDELLVRAYEIWLRVYNRNTDAG